MILYLVPLFTALTLLAAAAGIYRLQSRRRLVAGRLQRAVEGDLALEKNAAAGFDSSLPIGLRLIGLLAWLLPGQMYSESLRADLAQGGYNHPDTPKVFVGLRVISTVLLGVTATLVSLQLHLMQTEMYMLAIVGAGAGYFLPLIVLRSHQSKRQMEITLSLPDVLDLLVICVEAGQGLNAALLKVGRESAFRAKALSNELRILNNEMRAGIPRIDALRNLAFRTGVDDIRALVAVMIQSEKLGSSIAQALRVHAEGLRIKRRQRAEEQARKAPVKLVFPLVLCIFPELLVVILAPGMLVLFRALSTMVVNK